MAFRAMFNSSRLRASRKAASEAQREHGGRLYFLAREQFERYLVRLMVNRHSGSKRAAAKALGIGLSTVKEKVREPTPLWLEELDD